MAEDRVVFKQALIIGHIYFILAGCTIGIAIAANGNILVMGKTQMVAYILLPTIIGLIVGNVQGRIIETPEYARNIGAFTGLFGFILFIVVMNITISAFIEVSQTDMEDVNEQDTDDEIEFLEYFLFTIPSILSCGFTAYMSSMIETRIPKSGIVIGPPEVSDSPIIENEVESAPAQIEDAKKCGYCGLNNPIQRKQCKFCLEELV
jgi:hypothetical protein